MPPARIRYALIAILLIAFSVFGAHAQALLPVPPLTARVIDTAGTLDAAQRGTLEAKLAALEQDKGAQVVVLVVPTTAPEDIAAYANRVGNTWKIGRKGVGDGLILLVAVHFWIHAVSIIVLVISLYFVLAGNPGVEPVTAISSIVFFLGMLLFAWIAIPVINKS